VRIANFNVVPNGTRPTVSFTLLRDGGGGNIGFDFTCTNNVEIVGINTTEPYTIDNGNDRVVGRNAKSGGTVLITLRRPYQSGGTVGKASTNCMLSANGLEQGATGDLKDATFLIVTEQRP
jgi:hypothetical protein